MTRVTIVSIEYSKSAFKAHALEIMREVEETGEEVVITSHGHKALILRPFVDSALSPLERLRGTVVEFHSPTAPVDDDDWQLA